MLSVTTITSYLYCQRKLYLNYVLGIREPPKPPLALGTVRHDTYEGIARSEESIVCSITEKKALEEIKELYKNEFSEILRNSIRKNRELLEKLGLDLQEIFRKVWPLILKESESRAASLHSFMEMHLVYGRDLWEKLTPKIKSEYRIESEALQLRGIIDQLEIYENGFVPVELKTGKAYKIKGKTPCSLDLFRYKVYLKNPKVGDNLIFINAGAYNFSSTFCDLQTLQSVLADL